MWSGVDLWDDQVANMWRGGKGLDLEDVAAAFHFGIVGGLMGTGWGTDLVERALRK